MAEKMTEKQLRKQVIQYLHSLAAFSVENVLSPGAPDICCVAGWIELKIGKIRVSVNRIDVDVRPAQRAWHHRWRQHGGRSWFLTDVGAVWYVHDGLWASTNLGETPYEKFVEEAEFALGIKHRSFLADQFVEKVNKGWNSRS